MANGRHFLSIKNVLTLKVIQIIGQLKTMTYWTIKDHDGVLFSVNNYRYDFFKSQIVTCEYGILPSKLSVDNFKAIGISECELPSDVEIYDPDSVISPSQNDTVMLKITPVEMAKTLDILSSTSDEKRDNYYCVDEFSPVKLFNIRLFMSESDNLFFSTYAKLAFDGEQWKITLSKAWENKNAIIMLRMFRSIP